MAYSTVNVPDTGTAGVGVDTTPRGKLQLVKLDLGAEGSNDEVVGALPVSGPATDDELRATPLPVSISDSPTPYALTYTAPVKATVTTPASNIIAATTGFREVTLKVEKTASDGVYINLAGTATASHLLLDPGDVLVVQSAQAISALRAGAADTVVYVMAAT